MHTADFALNAEIMDRSDKPNDDELRGGAGALPRIVQTSRTAAGLRDGRVQRPPANRSILPIGVPLARRIA